MKTLSVKEFRRRGYLQELNRQFLHPLGLALSVKVDPETEEESFARIWDYRTEPEGIIFAAEMIDGEFIERAAAIEDVQRGRGAWRQEQLGYVIQPFDNLGNEQE